MNSPISQAQALAAVRWLIGAAGGYAVGAGYLTADQLVLVGGVAAALIPLIWSVFFTHTTAGTMAAAKVVVESGATAQDVAPLAQSMRTAGAVVNTASMPQAAAT